ncbi:hypothetical protein [Hanstruepera marina]|uniref:hypothetical protein n=1 Tax=Hanstruepera marina TaxID=2873265 RepID=UPI001CA66116|nr:hypothetical protein [Hanstruepera marina]
MKNLLSIFLIVLIFFSCEKKTKNEEINLEATDSDKIEILNTINNVYGNIKVDSVNKPNFRIIKDQFVESARLGYFAKDSLILKSPVVYFDGMKNMLSNNSIDYLREWEIKGETKFFGDIAQHTSLYGVHFNTTDSLAEKGIINFQLVKINNNWKILSMIWQSEKKDLIVPDNYFD